MECFERLSLAPQVISIIKEVDPPLVRKVTLELAMLLINVKKADEGKCSFDKLIEDSDKIADELEEFVRNQTNANNQTQDQQRPESSSD